MLIKKELYKKAFQFSILNYRSHSSKRNSSSTQKKSSAFSHGGSSSRIVKRRKNLLQRQNNYIQRRMKNLSKSLSIIYGLQTSLDFDKALEIANNLFQLYEYCRHEIIRGFSQKIEDGIVKAIDVIKQILEGWEVLPSLEK